MEHATERIGTGKLCPCCVRGEIELVRDVGRIPTSLAAPDLFGGETPQWGTIVVEGHRCRVCGQPVGNVNQLISTGMAARNQVALRFAAV